MLEKTVETYLVDRVRAAGGDAYKFSSPARVSVPDRIVIFPPARVYFVELKRPGNKPTKGQLREHERLRVLGCDVRVIDSREAVDTFVRDANAAPAQPPTTDFQQQVATTLRSLGVPMMLVSGEAPLAKLRALLKAAETRGGNSRADALTDLLPCPFCGAGATTSERGKGASWHPIIACVNWCCSVSGTGGTRDGMRASAVRLWNTRAAIAASPVEQREAAPADEAGARLSFNLTHEQVSALYLLLLRRQRPEFGWMESPLVAIEEALKPAHNAIHDRGFNSMNRQFFGDNCMQLEEAAMPDSIAPAQPEPAVADERAAFSAEQTCALKHAISSLTAAGLEASATVIESMLARAPNAAGAEGAKS